MYYYIFEQPLNSPQKRLNKKIKEMCADVGVAGETVSPSPARTIDELAEIGSSKGYSTVIAVGQDAFFNKVASSLLNHALRSKKEDQKIVLGFVPWYPEKSYLANLFGIANHNQAIETIKFRKLTPIKPAVITPHKFFVSPIEIKSTKRVQMRLTTVDFDTTIYITNLSVDKNLDLTSFDATYGGSSLQKGFRWFFGKPILNTSKSIFRHSQFTIESASPMPVLLEGETIAKTPITVRQTNQILHAITSRDRIISK